MQRFTDERKKSTIKDVWNKLVSFIVPYIGFSVIFWAFKMVFSKSVINPLTIKDLLLIWVFPLSDLWFLYVLCLFYIIHLLLEKSHMEKGLFLIIAIVISVFFSEFQWGEMLSKTALPRMCTNIAYYAGGISFVDVVKEKEWRPKHPIIIGVALMVIGALLCFIEIQIPIFTGLFKICSAFNSVMGVYCLGQIITVTPIMFLGKESLYIYLVHDYAVCASVIILWRLAMPGFMMTIIATISGLVFSLAVIWVCSKVKIFDAVFKPATFIKF